MKTPAMVSSSGSAASDAGDVAHDPRARRIEWPGRAGLAIVAGASLILSLNQTAQSLVSRPFAEWFRNFSEALWVNAVIGVAFLLAAVWARERYPRPGRAQYKGAFVAVLIAAILVSAALEVHFLIGVVILLAAAWVRYYPGRKQYAGALLAVVVAVLLAVVTLEMAPAPPSPTDAAWGFLAPVVRMAGDLAQYAVVALVITGAWLYTRTEEDHATAIAQCAVDSARMDEQTAEARLQMLEAQIEPHFLFNTLAHVKRLYEIDRTTGARMLRNLRSYLAVALPQMRGTETTLRRELDHAIAYLEIQQIRMGQRLAFGVDVDDALRGARLPPLMLLTLVENAIKHGLTPVPAGGRIDIRARIESGHLRVEVADTGGGFTKSGGAGAGLANIRARLAAQFGTDANLTLTMNSPCGVVATIALPYVSAATKAGAQ